MADRLPVAGNPQAAEPLVDEAPAFTRTRTETTSGTLVTVSTTTSDVTVTAIATGSASGSTSSRSITASYGSSSTTRSLSASVMNSNSSTSASQTASRPFTVTTSSTSTSHTLIYPNNGFPSDFPVAKVDHNKAGDGGRHYVFVDNDLVDGMLLFATFFGGLLIFSILIIKLTKFNARNSDKTDTMLLDDDKPDFHDEYSPDYEKERFRAAHNPGAPRGNLA